MRKNIKTWKWHSNSVTHFCWQIENKHLHACVKVLTLCCTNYFQLFLLMLYIYIYISINIYLAINTDFASCWILIPFNWWIDALFQFMSHKRKSTDVQKVLFFFVFLVQIIHNLLANDFICFVSVDGDRYIDLTIVWVCYEYEMLPSISIDLKPEIFPKVYLFNRF